MTPNVITLADPVKGIGHNVDLDAWRTVAVPGFVLAHVEIGTAGYWTWPAPHPKWVKSKDYLRRRLTGKRK